MPYVQHMTERQQKRMFAHAGIVAAASAILEDLTNNGMLSRLMRSETQRKADVHEGKDERQANGGQQTHGQKAGTLMQELLDKKARLPLTQPAVQQLPCRPGWPGAQSCMTCSRRPSAVVLHALAAGRVGLLFWSVEAAC